MSIQRYNCLGCHYSCKPIHEQTVDGESVSYTDHLAVVEAAKMDAWLLDESIAFVERSKDFGWVELSQRLRAYREQISQ